MPKLDIFDFWVIPEPTWKKSNNIDRNNTKDMFKIALYWGYPYISRRRERFIEFLSAILERDPRVQKGGLISINLPE